MAHSHMVVVDKARNQVEACSCRVAESTALEGYLNLHHLDCMVGPIVVVLVELHSVGAAPLLSLLRTLCAIGKSLPCTCHAPSSPFPHEDAFLLH